MTQPYEHLANLDANGKDFEVGFSYEKVVALAFAYADADAVAALGSDNSVTDFVFDKDFAWGKSTGLKMEGDVILNNAPDVLGGFGKGTAIAVALAAAVADAVSIDNLGFQEAEAKAVAIAAAYAKLDVTGLKGYTYECGGKVDHTAYMGHGPDLVTGIAKVTDIDVAAAVAYAEAFANPFFPAGDFSSDSDFDWGLALDDPAYVTAYADANAFDRDRFLFFVGEALAVAKAFAAAYANADTTAIGIDGGIYDLDSGPDKVFACAEGADKNMGVRDVVIYGGKGNDEFHLQSGTGDIYGGYDGDLLGKNGYGTKDLLSLEGSKDDYIFSAISGGVNIRNFGSLNETDMNVYDVEIFAFGGNTYTFAELVA